MLTAGAVAVANYLADRRRSMRIKAALQAEMQLPGQPFPIRVRTSDISLGGCYVEMMFTLAAGTQVNITVWLGSTKIQCQAEVATCDPQYGNGIRFLSMSLADKARLEQYLDRLQEAAPVSEPECVSFAD
jgi:c-di-GMP-binding flagellar brake protein YcgR